MDARGLTEEDFLVDVKVMSAAEIADVMVAQDVILSF
jgi:tRNA 2-thiouridine synthesizing protein C